ncbi:MAG: hypothetical protein BVN34_08420 [Proteobacteria bacterium ST_bin12]|nr:MAG: hypothetical protein BVN34_08420 [Proteobacteria bacterium ST_bin12]
MEVHAHISPSLHPKNVEKIADGDTEVLPYLNAAVEAFSEAYDSISKVYVAKDLAAKNQAWTKENVHMLVGELAEKHLTRVCKKFDSVVASMTTSIDALDGQLNSPITADAERFNISAEIRAHVKGLSVEDRLKFIDDAFASHDVATLRAILGAPSFLSGMSEKERQLRTRMLHEQSSPKTAKTLAALRRAKEMLETRGGLLFSEMEKAVGVPRNRIFELQKVNKHALDALKA